MKEGNVARIKHIAIATPDPAKTAQFYKDVFELEEYSPVDSPLADGYYLTDGHINLAILKFKSLEAADKGENGLDFTGFHHFGFEVEDAEATCAKLDEVGADRRTRVAPEATMGAGHQNVEIKYKGPFDVIVDVSQTGWVGTA